MEHYMNVPSQTNHFAGAPVCLSWNTHGDSDDVKQVKLIAFISNANPKPATLSDAQKHREKPQE